MLLEREHELEQLSGLVDALGEDGGKVVLIRGEAGIGKSALVGAFLAAQRERAGVLYGACDDLFIPQALGPFWDMARTDAALRGPIDAGDRPALLAMLMERLSTPRRPTLVVIEDTHWADEASLDAIRYLGRRIARTNGLLLLTYRDGEVDLDHPLRRVIGDIPAQDVVRLQLDGLSVGAVGQMLSDYQLDPEAVYVATRGNPLLVGEMAAEGGEGLVSASLRDAVLARLDRLPIASQEALKTLSVVPEPLARSDAVRLAGGEESRLDHCVQRGFLEEDGVMVAFRHDLIRRAVESVMERGERRAKLRAVLAGLPERTHPCLIIHFAAEVEDVDRLVDLAPRSARYAAAAGGHTQAAEDFRELGPHLDRFDQGDLGPLLDDWAREEFLVDDMAEAIRINKMARDHYRATGDVAAESRALSWGAHYHENAGERATADALAHEAVEILGVDPDGHDLARALEVLAYLQMMSGNVDAVPELVERTLVAGGPDLDESIRIRSLNHRGIVENIADYPRGRSSLDEARDRAEASGLWYEECRALFNHSWAASESRDLPVAADYAQRGIASAVRHELPGLEGYAKAMYARVLELGGDWDHAADLAREVIDAMSITQMVVLPIIGIIDTRRGRADSLQLVARGWELAAATGEVQRTAPAAMAGAEAAWVSGTTVVPPRDLAEAMHAALELGFRWSPGAIASWLWQTGDLTAAPDGIAQPYRDLIEGRVDAAADAFEIQAMPYERARALMHGDVRQRLEALEAFEQLGASVVAAKLRRSLRSEGVSVPRGKSHATRRHTAGLTARQAEVLGLLAEGLSNAQIADRLFVSPRTVENHVAAILDKLDAASRADAVARAQAEGLT